MSAFEEIKAIVKRRYETGAYGTAHFQIPNALLAAIRQGTLKPRMPWEGSPLGDLLSIPVVIDDTLGPDEWRLVDTLTKKVLAGTRLPAEQPEGSDR